MALLAAAELGTAQQVSGAPQVNARAAVLMEAKTGQVLWAKDQNRRLAPASTTKIMTALLALEKVPISKVVTVSENASKADGSSLWLEPGEKLTVEELLYGAMLNSGNDACVALAETVSGSEADFAKLMTARARKLGATATTFMNANGLPAAGHLTTAYDMALITRAALANPVFAAIAETKVKNIPWPGKDWDRRLINHNKLLWRYEGADGVKTGYTRESGHCLVASATRDGRQLIAVVLRSRDTYGETSTLLDYGFKQYKLVAPRKKAERTLPVTGGTAKSLRVKPKLALAYAIPAGQADEVRLLVHCPRSVRAPVRRGQELGWAALVYRQKTLARVPLIASGTVKRRGLFAVVADFIRRYLA